MGELVGREVKPCGGEWLCRLHPLHGSSVMAARTGNQSTAALSAHTIGPATAAMNGLSATLNVASLFNDKFGNVWIFLTGLAVQSESNGTFSLLCQPQTCGLKHVGGGVTHIRKLGVNGQATFALNWLTEFKCQD